jgi:hypothetical protein
MEFVNAGDWSFYDGHYYSNKSPGLSLLAVPSYALAEYCSRWFFAGDPERQVLFSTYACTLFTTVLMSSLLCLLLFHVLYDFFQMGMNTSLILTLFFGFGTIAFPYSTVFYCHQPAAFWVFLSFVLAMHLCYGTARREWLSALGAGFSASAAVLLEGSCLYLLIALCGYLLFFPRGRRCAFLFVVGCIPLALVQGWYNTICFGHPLAQSYDYANDMVMARVNGKLFGIPRLSQFHWLLTSPSRGLIFLSPLVLMALPGVVLFFKEKRWRAEAMLSAGISLFFIIFIASFFGIVIATAPRYLLPAFPFLFLLTVFSFPRFPLLYTIIGIISLLINSAITLVGIEIPWRVKTPLAVVAFTNIFEGRVSINPVPLSHFNHYPSIYELADMGRWTPNFNSFNLGEIIFPHSVASIIPLLCFWVLWGYWWSKIR